MNMTGSNKADAAPGRVVYLVLISRLLLFLLFQALVALALQSWEASEKYWLLTATLTNIVSISLLYILFRQEGKSYFRIFSFSRKTVRKDLFIFIGLVVVTVPIALGPGYLLVSILWEDATVPVTMMFGPIEKGLVYMLLIAFPVTIAFAELATYFMYVMPQLEKRLKVKWIAVLLPVMLLSIQHCTLPFIPDLSFILYRGLMFLPFATMIGISLYLRPTLFPYFAIFHGLMDFGTAYMFLAEL